MKKRLDTEVQRGLSRTSNMLDKEDALEEFVAAGAKFDL